MRNSDYALKKKKKHILLAIFTSILMLIYLVWRVLFTLPTVEEYGWFALILALALWIAELASAADAFLHCVDLSTKMEPEMPQIPEEWYPDVDVLIATHNEDEELLFKTVNACTYMRYPDPQKVHIYLCDDGNRESVKKLADQMGIGYLGMADNKYAKAGNLNNALSKTNSPLVATFDADMMPTSEFLMETVPYFFLPQMKKDENGKWVERSEEERTDEKIGFIQTPQSFYNPDLFQYNLFSEDMVPNEQDYFFRQVNVGRNAANAAIYAGSNTVIAREALEAVGGICTGTITEDFETGMLIESKGYRCFAVDKTLAKGLAPITIISLIKQRERWARGCIHSLRRHHVITNPEYSLRFKMSYLACKSYWNSFVRRFVYVLAPVLFVLLGIPAVICTFKELMLIWFPAYFLYGYSLKVMSGNIRNPRISNLVDTIMFPYLMVLVIAENLHIHKKEFAVTDKSRHQSEDTEKLLALPHLFLLIFSVVALIFAIRDLAIYQAYGSAVLIYWLFVNSGGLLMSIFFMLGRRNYRSSERFIGHIPVKITVGDNSYDVITEDFSEFGMSAMFPTAVYIPTDEEVTAEIEDNGYFAVMKMKVVSVVTDQKKGHKYGFQIIDIDEKNKREYYQIVYDRESCMPQTINAKSSMYGDIASNISRRLNKSKISQRKLVRITVNKEYPMDNGETVFVKNFNFEYLLLEDRITNPGKGQIDLGDGLFIECRKYRGGLYKVENLEELQENEAFNKIVEQWDMQNK